MSFELPEVVLAVPLFEPDSYEKFMKDIQIERNGWFAREKVLLDMIENLKCIGFRQSQELALLRISGGNKE